MHSVLRSIRLSQFRNGNFLRSISSCCSGLNTITESQTLPLGHRKLRNQPKSFLLGSFRVRDFSSSAGEKQSSEGELQLKATIKKAFPTATEIIVEDISGGCGSMYQIYIEAPDFKGLSTVKQHLLVNQALKHEIKNMHGIRIQTGVPP
ncbi:BolA-like protein 3 [Orchesella cincta]|uniref:BolA-like protein 3 n=1 Tax=Orchesella cincta TaxID=48709 RepID=A0A1D2N0Z1_ORCCI|nr:BolA-like protein 3 [Orchesella cincta]